MYEQAIRNVTKYLNKIQLTKINFMYFNASDLTQPKMSDRFKKIVIDNISYYISHGVQHNYWYIYRESTIKYLVNITLTSGIVYDIDIVDSGHNYNVNHGDHLDIGIIRVKTGNKIIVKTHKTIYTDLGGFVFDRSAPECNFVFDVTKFQDENTFDTIQCVYPDNSYCADMKNVYKSEDKKAILHMCQVMVNIITNGGRRKQQGGNIHDRAFWKYFIKHLTDIRKDVLEIRVIEDAAPNTNIVIIIDFIDYTRSILLFPKHNIPDLSLIHI